jgi:hypothetical protein
MRKSWGMINQLDGQAITWVSTSEPAPLPLVFQSVFMTRVVQTAPKGSGPPPEGVQGVRFLPPEVSSLPWAKSLGVLEPLPGHLVRGAAWLIPTAHWSPLVSGLVSQRQCKRLFLFNKHNALLLMPARLSSITRLIPALTAPVASHMLRKSVAIGQHGAITHSFAVEE